MSSTSDNTSSVPETNGRPSYLFHSSSPDSSPISISDDDSPMTDEEHMLQHLHIDHPSPEAKHEHTHLSRPRQERKIPPQETVNGSMDDHKDSTLSSNTATKQLPLAHSAAAAAQGHNAVEGMSSAVESTLTVGGLRRRSTSRRRLEEHKKPAERKQKNKKKNKNAPPSQLLSASLHPAVLEVQTPTEGDMHASKPSKSATSTSTDIISSVSAFVDNILKGNFNLTEKCPFSSYGCTVMLSSDGIQSHVQTDAHHHLTLVLAKCGVLRQQRNYFKEALSAAEVRNRQLQAQLHELAAAYRLLELSTHTDPKKVKPNKEIPVTKTTTVNETKTSETPVTVESESSLGTHEAAKKKDKHGKKEKLKHKKKKKPSSDGIDATVPAAAAVAPNEEQTSSTTVSPSNAWTTQETTRSTSHKSSSNKRSTSIPRGPSELAQPNNNIGSPLQSMFARRQPLPMTSYPTLTTSNKSFNNPALTSSSAPIAATANAPSLNIPIPSAFKRPVEAIIRHYAATSSLNRSHSNKSRTSVNDD